MQHDCLAKRSTGPAASVWLPAPERLALPEKAVQIWVLDDALLEPACSTLSHTLSPDERQRAQRYRHATHRDRFIARRGVLRCLLGCYLRCNPGALRFRVSPSGKPALQWPTAAIAFSVSHTDGMALLAFAWDCRLGVDVERRTDELDVPGIGRGIFSPAEARALDRAQAGPAALLRIWTRKEALLKALGTGLCGDPAAYTTEDECRRGPGHWRASHRGATLAGWTCVDLAFGPEIGAAVAVSLEDASVTLHHCGLSASTSG
jgi:4'-phosphopantetheinyl transferase